MENRQLFTLAPETIVMNANYVPGQGWHLRVLMRRQGQQWDDSYDVHYSYLSSAELSDVMQCEASELLQTSK